MYRDNSSGSGSLHRLVQQHVRVGHLKQPNVKVAREPAGAGANCLERHAP